MAKTEEIKKTCNTSHMTLRSCRVFLPLAIVGPINCSFNIANFTNNLEAINNVFYGKLFNVYSSHTFTIQIIDIIHFLLNVLPCHPSWKLKEKASESSPYIKIRELSNLSLVVPSNNKKGN